MYTFKRAHRTRAGTRLRRVATRTFVGAVCTLTSSVVCVYPFPGPLLMGPSTSVLICTPCSNLSVLMGLDGEPGWVCLMCCNSDSECPARSTLSGRRRALCQPTGSPFISCADADFHRPGSTLQCCSHPMGHIKRWSSRLECELQTRPARTRITEQPGPYGARSPIREWPSGQSDRSRGL